MVKLKQEMKDNATFPGSVEIDELDDQTKNKHELLLRHCIKTTNASAEIYIKESKNNVILYRLLGRKTPVYIIL